MASDAKKVKNAVAKKEQYKRAIDRLGPAPATNYKPVKMAEYKGSVASDGRIPAMPSVKAVNMDNKWYIPADSNGKLSTKEISVGADGDYREYMKYDNGTFYYDKKAHEKSASNSNSAKAGRVLGKAVNKVTDVLSRGQYAGAEFAKTAVKEVKKQSTSVQASKLAELLINPTSAVGRAAADNPVESAKAVKSGVTGKTKTSYVDVLHEAGVKGNVKIAGKKVPLEPIAQVAGNVGNLILDPTNLIGTGVIRGANAAEKAASTGKAIASTVEKVADEAKTAASASSAIREALAVKTRKLSEIKTELAKIKPSVAAKDTTAAAKATQANAAAIRESKTAIEQEIKALSSELKKPTIRQTLPQSMPDVAALKAKLAEQEIAPAKALQEQLAKQREAKKAINSTIDAVTKEHSAETAKAISNTDKALPVGQDASNTLTTITKKGRRFRTKEVKALDAKNADDVNKIAAKTPTLLTPAKKELADTIASATSKEEIKDITKALKKKEPLVPNEPIKFGAKELKDKLDPLLAERAKIANAPLSVEADVAKAAEEKAKIQATIDNVIAEHQRSLQTGSSNVVDNQAAQLKAKKDLQTKIETLSNMKAELSKVPTEAVGVKPKLTRIPTDRLKEMRALEGDIKTLSTEAMAAKPVPVNMASEIDAAVTASKATTPKGAVQFRIAGQPVASSETLYKVGATLKGQLTKSKSVQEARAWFNTDLMALSNKGGVIETHGANKLRQLSQNATMADAERFMTTNIVDVFKGVSEDSKTAITYAIESGKIDKLPQELQPLAAHAKKLLEDSAAAEHMAGIGKRTADHLDPNYVPHSFNSGTAEEVKAFKSMQKTSRSQMVKDIQKIGHSAIPEYTAAHGLDAAKAAGLNPTTQIDNVLSEHFSRHFSKMAEQQAKIKTVETYGVKISDRIGQEKAVAEGLVPVVEGSDMFIHKDIKRAMDEWSSLVRSPKRTNQLLDTIDTVHSLWKLQATATNPGHHVAGLIGDMMSNATDGVVTVGPYADAIKYIFTKDGSKVVPGVRLSESTAMRGQTTVADLYRAMVEGGAKSSMTFAENSERAIANTVAGKVTRSKPVKAFRKVSETREEIPRFAHFLDAFEKEAAHTTSFSEAVSKSVDRVIKFNHDYGALTSAEKKIRTAIPFYTFWRKNTPLMLRMLVERPGVMATHGKLMGDIQEAFNGDPSALASESPNYAKGYPIIATNDKQASHQILNLRSPLDDALRILDDPKGILNPIEKLSPFIKAPVELTAGKKVLSGSGQQATGSVASYITDQLRLPALGKKLSDKENSSEEFRNKIIRYGIGMGPQEVTAKQKLPGLQKGNSKLKKKLAELRSK